MIRPDTEDLDDVMPVATCIIATSPESNEEVEAGTILLVNSGSDEETLLDPGKDGSHAE